jgi:Flp pilus assembly protein TadD
MGRGIPFLVVFLVLLGGCFGTKVPQHRLDRAHQLVDEGAKALRAGKLDDADASFSMADELAAIPAAVDGRGCVALLKGDWDKAERFFIKAHTLDSEYTRALGNLGLLRDLQGRKEEAKTLYSKVLTYDPDNGEVRNNLAVLEYELKGSTLEALQQLKKADLSKNDGVIRSNIALLSQ